MLCPETPVQKVACFLACLLACSLARLLACFLACLLACLLARVFASYLACCCCLIGCSLACLLGPLEPGPLRAWAWALDCSQVEPTLTLAKYRLGLA